MNAMHFAAAGGHIEVIKFLLPLFGARVHEKDMNSYTMLHWAAWGGHCQVARYLITELKLDPQDREKVGARGLCWFQSARSTCVHGLVACGTCPIAAIWLQHAANFSFLFSLVSPAVFVGSEQD